MYLIRKLKLSNWNWSFLIALLGLLLSLWSAWVTQEHFRQSNRPYVWGMNIYTDERPMPHEADMRVVNAPAKIALIEIVIASGTNEIYRFEARDLVRVPAENHHWPFRMSEEEFIKVMGKRDPYLQTTRKVHIQYSSLEGGRQYTFTLLQRYDESTSDWSPISETAT